MGWVGGRAGDVGVCKPEQENNTRRGKQKER